MPREEKFYRTQILFSNVQMDRLKEESKKRKISISEIVKLATDTYLGMEKTWKSRKWDPSN